MLVSIDPKPRAPRPVWLRAPAPVGENYHNLKKLVQKLDLHTVCESGCLPQHWRLLEPPHRHLHDPGQRAHAPPVDLCAVQKGGPLPVDYDEPRRVAEACAVLGLKFAVRHAPASIATTVQGWRSRAVRAQHIKAYPPPPGLPECGIEVLTPDFQGSHAAMDLVLEASPDVLNHNTETVPRLYRQVRLGARYERSLDMLAYVKQQRPEIPAKSGLMLGLGETLEEVHQVMRDLRQSNVDILTLGQYLRPSLKHLPIIRYVSVEEFAELSKSLGWTSWDSSTSKAARWYAALIMRKKR